MEKSLKNHSCCLCSKGFPTSEKIIVNVVNKEDGHVHQMLVTKGSSLHKAMLKSNKDKISIFKKIFNFFRSLL